MRAGESGPPGGRGPFACGHTRATASAGTWAAPA